MIPKIKRILYTTDLSPNSGYVLRYAEDLAEKYGARLIVLHVVEAMWSTDKMLVGPFLDDEKLANISEEKMAYAKARILKRFQFLGKKALGRTPDAIPSIDSIEVVEGYPADEILAKADAFDCDAIVMGTHGKGFLQYAYFGSTSKKVLRRARKPIFIIPLPMGETDVTVHDR